MGQVPDLPVKRPRQHAPSLLHCRSAAFRPIGRAGFLNSTALLLLTLSLVIAACAIVAPGIGWVERLGPRLLPIVAGLALVFQFWTLLQKAPAAYLGPVVTNAVALPASLLVTALALWKLPRTPAAFAAVLGLQFPIFFLFNNSACNYYYMVLAMFGAAVAFATPASLIIRPAPPSGNNVANPETAC